MKNKNEKEIEYMNRKFRLYKKLNILCWIIWITLFLLLIGCGKDGIHITSVIIAIITIPGIIAHIIIRKKKINYQNTSYDLYIHEASIKDTQSNENLK